MGKTIGEASLRVKIKFDMPNIHPNGNVGMEVKFRGKSVLKIKLLGLLIYTWYYKTTRPDEITKGENTSRKRRGPSLNPPDLEH